MERPVVPVGNLASAPDGAEVFLGVQQESMAMSRNGFEFDGVEVTVCILIAFCLGNAALSVIYDLMT